MELMVPGERDATESTSYNNKTVLYGAVSRGTSRTE